MRAIFSYVSNLTFCKRNNAKIILLIIFSLVLFFLHQTVTLQKKEKYMNIYRYILCIIIYVYICLYIFLYKKFLPGIV